MLINSGCVVQALGAGGARAFSDIATHHLLPAHKVVAYRGQFHLLYFLGAAFGPIIGGAIVGIDWRWCFYLHLITGGFSLICLLLAWNHKHKPGPRVFTLRVFNLIGVIFIQGSTISVLIGLAFGGIVFPWNSAHVISPIIIGGFGWIVFGICEFTCNKSTVPLYLFTNRSLAAGSLMHFSTQAVLGSVTWMLPVYLMGVTTASPFTSSVNQLPLSLVVPTAMLLAGGLGAKGGNKLPHHLICLICFFLAGLGVGIFVMLGPKTPTALWVVFQGITAVGLGSSWASVSYAIPAIPLPEETLNGWDTQMLFANLDTIWGVAISSVIFNGQVNRFLYRIGENPVRKELANGNAYGFVSQTGLQQLASEIKIDVAGIYADSLKTVWLVAVGFAGLGILATLLMGLRRHSPSINEPQLGLEDNKAERPGKAQ